MLARNRGRAGATSNSGRKASPLPADLQEAVTDLDECRDEAREEGYPTPSDIALHNAGLLLRSFYAIAPARYEVYPMPDGDVAVDFIDGSGHSVTAFCDSKGGVFCITNGQNGQCSQQYEDAQGLPDDFLKGALATLEIRVR